MTTGRWPNLSVVLVVRNGMPELQEQLEALRNQLYPGVWELVAVDDGSTDGSRAALEGAVEMVPNGCVVDELARGCGAARRTGVSAAHGDALIFIDHDDTVAPGYLIAMGAAMREHEFVAARVDLAVLNPQWIRESRPPQQTHSLPVDRWPFGSGGTIGIRRNVYDELGGHDQSRGPEDRDLCFRAARAGIALTFVPDAVLHYRYPSNLRAIFHKARRGGRCDAWLYRRHGNHGYPARSAKAEVVKLWRASVMVLSGIIGRDRAAFAGGVHRLGRILGHVEGCFIERVGYLRWNLGPQTGEPSR